MTRFFFLCLHTLLAFSAAAQWTPVPSANSPDADFAVVWGMGADKAFAVSDDKLFSTDNGGQTWQIKDLSAVNTTPFQAEGIHFFDSQHGIVVGDRFGVLVQAYATHDGGQTWIETFVLGFINTQANDVEMVSPQTAFVACDKGYLARTDDGGQSWQLMLSGATAHWLDVDFIDAQRGKVLSNEGLLYATNDGGDTWQVLPTPGPTLDAHIQFFDANNGYLYDGNFYKTTDGGKHWTLLANPGLGGGAFFFTTPLKGWIAGYAGQILTTNDGGQTWLFQTNPLGRLVDIHVNGSTGWAVGGNFSGPGKIYKTTNGGGFGMDVSGPTGDICAFETATYTCVHDGAASFEWRVNGLLRGNQAVFNFSPTADGEYAITCTAKNGAQSVSRTKSLTVFTEPILPFYSQNIDSICVGIDLSLQIGPLKAGYQYRIQEGAAILKEWIPASYGAYNWQHGPLQATRTFDFYAFYSNCGWQKVHSRTVHVVKAPKTDLAVGLPAPIVCEKAPFAVRVEHSEPSITYQVWSGDKPWGAVFAGGQSPLTLTANGTTENRDLRVFASASSQCRAFLNDVVHVQVMLVEPTFAVSTQTIGLGEALLVDNTSADSLTFQWQFTGADPDVAGSVLPQALPVHFGQQGDATVALIARSPAGCLDTLRRTVQVIDASTLGTSWIIAHDMKEQKTLDIDSAGNVYGYTDWYAKKIGSRPASALKPDDVSAVFYKHNPKGVLQWHITINDGDHIPRGANIIDLCTDRQGNTALLVGLFRDPGHSVTFSSTDGRAATTDKENCMAIAVYSPFGVLRSLRFLESLDTVPDSWQDNVWVTALTRDAAGDFFLLGNTASPYHSLKLLLTDLNGTLDTISTQAPGKGPYFLLKYGENGHITWVKNISAYYTAAGYGLAFRPLLIESDRIGGCYVLASGDPLPQQVNTSLGVRIEHFDKNGLSTWHHDGIIYSGYHIWANDLTVDQAGNAYLLGNYRGGGGFSFQYGSGAFLVKVGRNGAIKWRRDLRDYNNSINNHDRGLGVAVDETNKVYVLNSSESGHYRMFIDPICIDTTFPSLNSLFLTTWDSLGNLLQIAPSKNRWFNPSGSPSVARHLRVQKGVLYASGAYGGFSPDIHFLGNALPVEGSTYLARLPIKEDYWPYMNTCDHKRCERDSLSKLQISYLFDQIQWYRNDTLLNGYDQAAIVPPKSGKYTARATDPNGHPQVSPMAAAAGVYPFPEAVISRIDSGLTVPFYPGTDYWWRDSAGNFLALHSNTGAFYPDSAGWYQVYTWGEGSCRDSSGLFYYDGLVSTKIPVDADWAINIFPNPATDVFTMTLPKPAPLGMLFRITDLTGRILTEIQAETGGEQHTIPTERLPAGLYFLQVMAAGKVLAVEKFVRNSY